jgi:hypothetical protein
LQGASAPARTLQVAWLAVNVVSAASCATTLLVQGWARFRLCLVILLWTAGACGFIEYRMGRFVQQAITAHAIAYSDVRKSVVKLLPCWG